jgi:ABC-type antimicrobial peptide transport system permease subunit
VPGTRSRSERSLDTRLWRFAALRALGLGRSQLWAQVQIEYLTILLGGVGLGAAIGVAASRVFVPFFRVTTEAGILPLPPLVPMVDLRSALTLALAFAGMQIVIQVGLLRRATRAELFQVLRMGARE